MIERSDEERALIAEAERLFPTQTRCLTFDPNLNFCVGKAKGSHIWDVSGNEYVDYLLGSGPPGIQCVMWLSHLPTASARCACSGPGWASSIAFAIASSMAFCWSL